MACCFFSSFCSQEQRAEKEAAASVPHEEAIEKDPMKAALADVVATLQNGSGDSAQPASAAAAATGAVPPTGTVVDATASATTAAPAGAVESASPTASDPAPVVAAEYTPLDTPLPPTELPD